jgi:hypothetical protein
MRFTAPKRTAVRKDLQERWRRERAAAQTLRTGFPRVERMRIELSFLGENSFAPAAQTHILHPAAQAFFAFQCPYSDCDGRFDLSGVVTQTVARSADHAEGTLECSGVRFRDGQREQACLLRLKFSLTAHYAPDEGSEKQRA